jgi:hypothetical protein
VKERAADGSWPVEVELWGEGDLISQKEDSCLGPSVVVSQNFGLTVYRMPATIRRRGNSMELTGTLIYPPTGPGATGNYVTTITGKFAPQRRR